MRKLFFLFMTATLLFTFSSCKSSGGDNNGLLALLGLGGENLEVLSTTPANGATDVPRNQIITVNFNSNVDASTIDDTTFIISPSIGGSYGTVGNSVTFDPSSTLDENTEYTITLTTELNNDGPDPLLLKSNYIFSFTTGTTSDDTPPDGHGNNT